MQRIIIIGGMGPQASLELHRRIIEHAVRHGAINGPDFPHIVHLSLPIDDFISNQAKAADALEQIVTALMQLSPTVDDHVVIACNTAHILRDKIEQRTGATVISLIATTVHTVINAKIQTVQLIASPTTLQTRLYERALEEGGVIVKKPTNSTLRLVERSIRAVIRGETPEIVRSHFAHEVPVLLGCTELSVALSGAENTIDPLDIIVDTLMQPTT